MCRLRYWFDESMSINGLFYMSSHEICTTIQYANGNHILHAELTDTYRYTHQFRKSKLSRHRQNTHDTESETYTSTTYCLIVISLKKMIMIFMIR